MLGTTEVRTRINDKDLIIQTGSLAKQANGAVFVRFGDTVVLAAATMDKPREGLDFFPLMVDYREKTAAAGRFPGGYFKREGRPTERETLIARMTDRPLRPLFPEGFRNDLQVQVIMLSADGQHESDVLSIVGASAALTISDIPFDGPLGAVRVGRVAGRWVANPTHDEMKESDIDLIYVGLEDDKMVMIEGSAAEVSEADFAAAMEFGQEHARAIIRIQRELQALIGKPKTEPVLSIPDPALVESVRSRVQAELHEAMLQPGKKERQARVDQITARAIEAETAARGTEVDTAALKQVIAELEKETMRSIIARQGRRLDGRGTRDLRQISGSTSVLPRTHGSAVFTRGETQTLCITTLGSNSDVQSLDALIGGEAEKRFILHYSFPPFSVGEIFPIRGPGRREIGHGALAERSLAELMPKDWPYVVRVNSEIMESNGSTSMASVCGGSLALMDAGVPLRKHVAGISIGLISDGPNGPITLTDIMGAEDHYGDMDFKVAGTRDGITGYQVDLKIPGLSFDLVRRALEEAREARLKILDVMESILPAARPELSPYAPRITVLRIDPDKIGALIGPGGKNIRRITSETGCTIDIEDTGEVFIFSASKEGMAQAVREVEAITAEAEVGKIYKGTVKGVKEFGAFVEILPGTEGLVHISEMADFRIRSVDDVCKVGDPMWVKVIEIDDRGKIRLSRREALAEKDVEASGETAPEAGAPTPPAVPPPAPRYEQAPAGPSRYDQQQPSRYEQPPPRYEQQQPRYEQGPSRYEQGPRHEQGPGPQQARSGFSRPPAERSADRFGHGRSGGGGGGGGQMPPRRGGEEERGGMRGSRRRGSRRSHRDS